MARAKILVCANSAWNLFNFRAELIREFLDAGHDVVAVAPSDEYEARLRALGCRFLSVPMDCRGTNPFRDLALLWRLTRLIWRERPAAYVSFTAKPNIYGSLAARLVGVPSIANVAGLGSGFTSAPWVVLVTETLYRLALRASSKVFFQNPEDHEYFVKHRLVRASVADRLPGSGVDLRRFLPASQNKRPPFRFLLVGRMLWEKGINEYVSAARLLKGRYPDVEFGLLGFVDVRNPSAISGAEVEKWVEEGIVRYHGSSDDVLPFLGAADCVVLPSYYREGVPRSLLEAAACGKPIITTDSVGCREVVEDGVNGLLCQPRSAADLAEKMEKLISMSWEHRARMGAMSRVRAERLFDVKLVTVKYLEVVESLVSNGPAAIEGGLAPLLQDKK